MTYKFKVACSSCHYNEIVSAGETIGEYFACQTYQCLNCKTLFDWYTVVGNEVEGFGDILLCPTCDKGEIVAWDYEKGVCPKCCQSMKIVALVEYR